MINVYDGDNDDDDNNDWKIKVLSNKCFPPVAPITNRV